MPSLTPAQLAEGERLLAEMLCIRDDGYASPLCEAEQLDDESAWWSWIDKYRADLFSAARHQASVEEFAREIIEAIEQAERDAKAESIRTEEYGDADAFLNRMIGHGMDVRTIRSIAAQRGIELGENLNRPAANGRG